MRALPRRTHIDLLWSTQLQRPGVVKGMDSAALGSTVSSCASYSTPLPQFSSSVKWVQ